MKYVQPLGAADNTAYVDGNPSAGIEGSIVPAAALEHPQREILAVILAAGLTPASTDLGQLLQAIQILSSSGGVPVGAMLHFKCIAPPAGWKELNGMLVSRAAYPALWVFAQTSGLLLASDDLWVQAAKGMFSPGDGSTTFRLPDHRGTFNRALDSGAGIDVGRAAGSFQGDAIRNITASITAGKIWEWLISVSGAFTTSTSGSSNPLGNTSNKGLDIHTINFDASRIVPTAADNRPMNIADILCIKY
jgi:microcystin-dependent protein